MLSGCSNGVMRFHLSSEHIGDNKSHHLVRKKSYSVEGFLVDQSNDLCSPFFPISGIYVVDDLI